MAEVDGRSVLLGPRSWSVPEQVEWAEEDGESWALRYTPRAVVEGHQTARGLFPEWFGHPDLPPRSSPKQAEDFDLLSRFLALTGGQEAPESLKGFLSRRDQRVLSFAREHGVLRFCEHGLPFTHRDGCRPSNPEPLEAWWKLARFIRATVTVVEKERAGERASEADLATLAGCSEEEVRAARRGGSLDTRELVSRVLSRWLDLADFRTGVRWRAEGPELEVLDPATSRTPLFAALARQLTLTVFEAERLAVCDGCRKVHKRERAPATGRRTFCEECRERRVPEKLRMRDYRRRKSEES